jgi:hypothetical protein
MTKNEEMREAIFRSDINSIKKFINEGYDINTLSVIDKS